MGRTTLLRTINYTYDMAGNILTETDPDSVYTFTYDALNNLKSVDNAGTPGVPHVVLKYAYDKNGNRTSVSDNAGVSVVSAYNSRNFLKSEIWQGGGIDPASAWFSYYANGAMKTLDRSSNTTGTQLVAHSLYQYDKAGRVTHLLHQDASTNTLADYVYTYFDNGLLKTESHHGVSVSYQYDPTGQLTDANSSDGRSEFYRYDPNGNRTSSYLSAGYQTGTGNQILSDDQFDCGYDKAGNLTTKTEKATGAVTTYHYDFRNRLIEVTEKSAGGILLNEELYTYDMLDRRIKVTSNGAVTTTVYDGANVWADFGATGQVTARYLLGNKIDQMLARWRPGEGTSWYLTDKLGTVRDLINAAGQVVNHIEYGSFGNIVSQSNQGNGDRFLFTAREWDSTSDLYYYRSRYFDFVLGRFTLEDSLGYKAGDANLYRYVGNSTTNGLDPTGQESLISESSLVRGFIANQIAALRAAGSAAAYSVFQWTSALQNWLRAGRFGEVIEDIQQTVHGNYYQTILHGGRDGAAAFFQRLTGLTVQGERLKQVLQSLTVEFYPSSDGYYTIEITYLRPFIINGVRVVGETIRFANESHLE